MTRPRTQSRPGSRPVRRPSPDRSPMMIRSLVYFAFHFTLGLAMLLYSAIGATVETKETQVDRWLWILAGVNLAVALVRIVQFDRLSRRSSRPTQRRPISHRVRSW